MKKYILFLILSIIVLGGLPFLFINSASGGVAFVGLVYLLLIVNPLYMIFMGYHCGKNIKQLWSLPVVATLIFWICAAIFVKMDIQGCVIYSIIYILAAVLSMTVSYIFFHRKTNKNNSSRHKIIKILCFFIIMAAFFALAVATIVHL